MTDDELRALIERIDAAEAAETDVISKASEAIKQAEARRTGLQGVRITLKTLYAPPPEFDGLADACRTVLRQNAGKSMSPIEVRDAVDKAGYDLKKHTNPLASIHSVLRQMAESKGNTDVKSDRRVPPVGTLARCCRALGRGSSTDTANAWTNHQRRRSWVQVRGPPKERHPTRADGDPFQRRLGVGQHSR
jgi:hypothetical protein